MPVGTSNADLKFRHRDAEDVLIKGTKAALNTASVLKLNMIRASLPFGNNATGHVLLTWLFESAGQYFQHDAQRYGQH